jgi:hypothetical protein
LGVFFGESIAKSAAQQRPLQHFRKLAPAILSGFPKVVGGANNANLICWKLRCPTPTFCAAGQARVGGSQAATMESRPDRQGRAAAGVGPRLRRRRPTLLSQLSSQGRGLVRRRLWSRGLTARAGQPPVLGRDSVVAAQLSSASRAGAGGAYSGGGSGAAVGEAEAAAAQVRG